MAQFISPSKAERAKISEHLAEAEPYGKPRNVYRSFLELTWPRPFIPQAT